MAGFASGKLSVENVDLDSSQTLENKVLDASNDFSGDIIDPSRSDVKQGTQAELEAYASGASNGQMCFATDTKQMYQVLDGALAAVGGGSGGLDTFFTDTFEVAGVSDYTSGNDAIFDNGGSLAGALADETVNNISGDQSLKYTQAAGSLNDFIKSPLIPIGKKQQGNTVGLELFYTYSGNSDDLKIVGYDDTGSEVMTLSSNLIKASSKAQRLSVQFPVPSGSANLAWGIQVVVENIGAILVVDDVQISTNPYVSKDLLDTPVIVEANNNSNQAITSATNIPFGTTIKDTTASWNGSEFTVPESGKYDFEGCMRFVTGQQGKSVQLFIDSGAGYIASDLLAYFNSVNNVIYKFSGSKYLQKDEKIAFRFSDSNTLTGVPSQHYIHIEKTPTATEHIVAYNSRNAENSMVRLHTGNGHGSVNNKIRRFSTTVADLGNAITYADSATDGASFTINEDGVYMISYTDSATSAAVYLGLSLNSTQLTTNIEDITVADRLSFVLTATQENPMSWAGSLNKGDVIRAHTQGSANASKATFTISKIGVGDLLGTPVPRTAYIKDVKSSGTSGGTFTSGAWRTRDLNTLEGDTEFVSLSANQIILAPGKYEIEASVSAYRVNLHKAKIRNITDSTDDIIGSNKYSTNVPADSDLSHSEVIGTINITSSKTFEIQHRSSATRSNDGFGVASSFGVDEIYTTIKIKKVS